MVKLWLADAVPSVAITVRSPPLAVRYEVNWVNVPLVPVVASVTTGLWGNNAVPLSVSCTVVLSPKPLPSTTTERRK
jgi:hypothetical protein